MTTRTLAELASLCGAELSGDGERRITGPASLEDAGAGEISFLANPRYADQLASTAAAAVVIALDVEVEQAGRNGLALLRCSDPNAAFSKIVSAFASGEFVPEPGVHASAAVDPTAELGADVAIGAGCVVERSARIGDGAVLHAGVVVGAGAVVGERTVLHPNVVLYARCEVGASCIVHAGTVIGSDGFGFDPSPSGWIKVPQCGNVVIEDDVEIGANAAIDRARFGTTHIGRGVKIDNLVHVAHNVKIGDNALLVAQVGVSGSCTVGRMAILGGQTGLAGHVTVGDGARIGGGSGVFADLAGGVDYLGYPARPRREALRAMAVPKRVERISQTLSDLERRLARLEEDQGNNRGKEQEQDR
jgi:UDP-3-O-[3-hydroxymyristoyl] glucosamine N-acyltransferase